jgi:quinoprotein glucose dehydrogenase
MSWKRLWRVGRWLGAALAILPLVFWVGVSIALKLTQLSDTPMGDILAVVGGSLVSTVHCAALGCEPELLEGMESSVFDSTLLESTPVALEIDEWGRVFVAETGRQNHGAEDNRSHPYWLEDDLASRTVEDRRAYYRKWLSAGKFEDPDHFTSASDRLVRLVDGDGDGVADERAVLASWNELASGLVAGIEAREGTLWVTSIPSVYRVEDRDFDARPESVETLQTGFGVKTSLIGHDLHGLVWGPDGRLYFSMGDRGYHVETPEGEVLEPAMGPGRGAIFRMNPDGSELEVFATGVRNPQELAFDDHGNLFTGDNNGDGGDAARLVYLVEGGETGWAMAYQSLAGDYIRGPWVAERLWDLQHSTQPAWVLPPVAHIGNGPAGFVHYPGLGLPARYEDAFFLCDYAYTPGRSGIWSFRVEPDGAGMRMVDRHKFAWSVLATDFDFSWDGRMFATLFNQFSLSQELVAWRHPQSQEDPQIEQLRETAQRPMRSLDPEELLALLRFPDQRLRLRAQYALAERGEVEALVALARNPDAPEVPRLHALWGLGQQGATAVAALTAAGTEWLDAQDGEFRAQFAKVAGDAGAAQFAPLLRSWLLDASPRVRFFAAQSLGALADPAAVARLFEVLRENDDQDVFLRHAAVWALHRIDEPEAAWDRRDDPSRAVRMGALLVLRHARDGRIAHFLADPDPLLVVEAARAIYDGPVRPAMPALAALAASLSPAEAEDPQVSQALHRRVIGANVALRSERGAGALAAYARDEDQLESLRALALDALGSYSQPPVRDLTMGFHRPLEASDPALLAAVFRSQGRGLIESSLGARAMEIASETGNMPLDDNALDELVRAPGASAAERVAALRALAASAAADTLSLDPGPAIAAALAADEAATRIAGRDLQLATAPAAGLGTLLVASRSGTTRADRQHAWHRLGTSADDRAKRELAQALDAWEQGALEEGVALEVFEAALAQGDSLGERARRFLATPDPARGGSDLEARRWALAGGDAGAGEIVFQTIGDCQRCHGGGGGHGGGAGPALAGVGRRGARHVLESLVAPSAEIAPGFGSVVVTDVDGRRVGGLLLASESDAIRLDTGGAEPVVILREKVRSQTEPVSGMPALGLALEPRALRDVVTYVMSIE